MNAQLAELLTNYGPLGGIWFDGMWDKPDADWRLSSTYSLIHRLQPQALVISNHHRLPFPGEDVQTFEQDLPGQNTAGFNTTEISALPLETAATMNESWGFNLTDREFKSVPQLVGLLAAAAAAGGAGLGDRAGARALLNPLCVKERRGGYDAGVVTAPDPEPGPGEVLVRVAAPGLTRADLSQTAGRYPPPPGESPILGMEVSGNRADTGEADCKLLAATGSTHITLAPPTQL